MRRVARRVRRPAGPVVPRTGLELAALLDSGADPRELLVRRLPAVVRLLPVVQDPAYLDVFCDRVPTLLEGRPAGALREVDAQVRVAYEHVRRGDRAGLEHLLTHEGLKLDPHDASVGPHGPVVHLPGWDEPALDRDAFVLADHQVTLDARVLRVLPVGTGAEVVVWAYLRHVEAPSSARAWAVVGDERTELSVSRDPEVPGLRLGAWRAAYDRSVWRVAVPAGAGPAGLELEVTAGGVSRRGLVERVDQESSAAWTHGTDAFRLGASPAAPVSGPRAVVLDVSGDALTVRVAGALPGQEVALVSPVLTVSALLGADGIAVVPLVADRWGRGARPLPTATYALLLDGEPVRPGHAVDLPLAVETDQLAGWWVRAGEGTALRLTPPRPVESRTMHGHRELRRSYREREVAVDPDVAMFQSYWAESATDSPLAICQELLRQRPSTKAFWGVLDHSVPVPEGTTALVAGSPEWYDVLARARFLVRNTELGAYTRLRPGQVHVQTFHGQVFKTMGTALWRDVRKLPEFVVQHEATTRRSDVWGLITTADPSSDRYYRELYGYRGPVHHHGLPRTDALLAPGADVVRARTRELLGIAPDQVAVLHAATWRDDRTTGVNAAADVQHVSMEALAERLGPGFVVLQRSHGSVARSSVRHGDRPGVVDVTDHPEINDLVLASDVAVLDYSSLRFDYAVTGRPMVFLVPDLEQYREDVRGFLFDFEPTAPGPWVRDLDGLVDALSDLDAVREAHATAYAAFNERFNRWHDGHAAERAVQAMLALPPV